MTRALSRTSHGGASEKMPELQHWESSDEIESSRGGKGQCQKTEEHGSVNISECT